MSRPMMASGRMPACCMRRAPPGIIDRIHRALRPGGVLYASFKAGEAEGRDGLGRYFNYLSSAELRATFGHGARWQSLTIDEDTGSGYDRQPTRWLHALAIKPSEP